MRRVARRATPLPSRSAVSKDSARRCAMSGRTLKRSTTASMSCLRFGSSFGAASSSYDGAVDAHAHEALRCQVRQHLLVLALARGHHRRQQQAAFALGQLQHLVDHLADGLRGEVDAVLGAARNAGARIQQAQVVVDLGDRAHGGARIVARWPSARWRWPATGLRWCPRPACPSSTGTGARRPTATPRSGAAPRHRACRRPARTCPSRTGR